MGTWRNKCIHKITIINIFLSPVTYYPSTIMDPTPLSCFLAELREQSFPAKVYIVFDNPHTYFPRATPAAPPARKDPPNNASERRTSSRSAARKKGASRWGSSSSSADNLNTLLIPKHGPSNFAFRPNLTSSSDDIHNTTTNKSVPFTKKELQSRCYVPTPLSKGTPLSKKRVSAHSA
jgi:hypothetical protein